ncbi:Growth factor receptor-bound protein 10 [Liparis tanakae]|uniref:Growth factor receptor-bound protein 10 n=1 Tax=Liparis tanakae TaxID=230148 RepID=A0A4Z2INZ4_9TELE|nr:Growth factor receptor-bound protein 10 [Liparis tanakae]
MSVWVEFIEAKVEDDVDLEALVNDMNSSLESLYSTCSGQQTDSTPLLHNGQISSPPHHHHHVQHNQPRQGQPLQSLSHVSPEPGSSQTSLRRSQPMHILAVRRLQEEDLRTSSLPAIPNPFPELCSPASSPVLSPGSLPPGEPSTDIYIVKIFSEDGMCKVVEIPADMTARDLCQLLVYKSHCVDDNSWALVEHHPLLGLERCLEDHELVVQVQASMNSDSRFLFRKNYAKYEFFRNPQTFFPEQMVAWCQETNRMIPPSQLLQNFLATSSCPEIQGYQYVKEEPRHLQFLADLEDSNIFTVISGKKQHGAPTDYEFCIKPNKCRGELKELRMLCAEDEQGRTCWITAFRLFKRSVSENSLVAMDFSGRIGRVIENPVEAQSAAMEEGHAWRCEEDGQVFFSLDDSATKFTDLIQLVEFYQLNRGVLPCKLKHPCTAVAL